MIDDLHKETKASMESSADAFRKELKRIRTGRASLALLDGMMVQYLRHCHSHQSIGYSFHPRAEADSYSALGPGGARRNRKSYSQIGTGSDAD